MTLEEFHKQLQNGCEDTDSIIERLWRAEAEVERLVRELKVAEAFHKVAVQQRDCEQAEVERLKALLAEVWERPWDDELTRRVREVIGDE